MPALARSSFNYGWLKVQRVSGDNGLWIAGVHVHGSGIRGNRSWCDWFAEVRRVAVRRGGHLVILRNGLVETKENEVAVGDIVPVPGMPLEEALTTASIAALPRDQF
jgi:hypothetical protein